MARKRYKPKEIVNLLRCQRWRDYVPAGTDHRRLCQDHRSRILMLPATWIVDAL